MRKLLSIGIVLALLVTFVVPGVVGAQEECENPCDYEPPECGPLPDRTTKTPAGAVQHTSCSRIRLPVCGLDSAGRVIG